MLAAVDDRINELRNTSLQLPDSIFTRLARLAPLGRYKTPRIQSSILAVLRSRGSIPGHLHLEIATAGISESTCKPSAHQNFDSPTLLTDDG